MIFNNKNENAIFIHISILIYFQSTSIDKDKMAMKAQNGQYIRSYDE